MRKETVTAASMDEAVDNTLSSGEKKNLISVYILKEKKIKEIFPLFGTSK